MSTELNVQLIGLERIETKIQVRPIDKEHVARLAASMKEHGQLVPIVVHEPSVKNGTNLDRVLYPLGPGRHRLEAARKLGWSSIAAIVKPPATDHDLRAEQVRENLERKDLTPLEEADLCADLLNQVEGDVAQAAAIMGRPVKWVEQRAALTRLSPQAREWVLDGSLPLAHSQLIARLPDAEQQDDIADQARGVDGEPAEALFRVKQWVEQRGRNLGLASWELDAVFGEANRACNTCPFNSANTRGLFDGDAPKKGGCLESTCFHDKLRLTGLAARKSANYLRKEDLATTPANAKKAREAREVPFVTTKAVLDMVAHTKAPAKKTTSGKAKSTEPNKPKGPTPEKELDQAVENWNEQTYREIEKAAEKSPTLKAFLILLNNVGDRWSKKPNDLAVVRGFAKRTAKLDGALLLEVAKHQRKNAYMDLDSVPDEVFEDVAAALEIKLKPKPTLESIKAELAKKAEATNTNEAAAGKKKAKRK